MTEQAPSTSSALISEPGPGPITPFQPIRSLPNSISRGSRQKMTPRKIVMKKRLDFESQTKDAMKKRSRTVVKELC